MAKKTAKKADEKVMDSPVEELKQEQTAEEQVTEEQQQADEQPVEEIQQAEQQPVDEPQQVEEQPVEEIQQESATNEQPVEEQQEPATEEQPVAEEKKEQPAEQKDDTPEKDKLVALYKAMTGASKVEEALVVKRRFKVVKDAWLHKHAGIPFPGYDEALTLLFKGLQK